MTTAGSDAVGSYRETTFSYSNAGTRNGRIRAYDHLPVVVFGETNPAAGSNIRNFPVLSTVPATPTISRIRISSSHRTRCRG